MVITALGLEKRGHNVFLLSHPRSEINKALPDGIKLIEKKLGPSYNPAMIVYLVLFIKRNNIDLIITNIDKEVAIGGIASRLTGIPNIRRVGREDDFNNRFRSKWCHLMLVNQCIAPCKSMIENALKRAPWLNKNQFKVIYNGRDIRQYSSDSILSLKNVFGIPPDKKILGITCQLTKKKYVDHLIEMFAEISGNYPDWVLVITGSGPEEKYLKNLASTLGIKSRVYFTGFTNDPMRVCSIYDIAFSVSKIEGFPNTVVEYMATGCSVIATDVGGIREIINNGVNGFIISFGNKQQLVDKTIQLIENDELRRQFSRLSLETIEKSFTEKNMILQLEKYLMEVINKR